MATTEELILRVKYDIEKGGIAFASDQLKKYADSTKAADAAVKQMEKSVNTASRSFDAQQKRLNGTRDAIVRSAAAFSGLGGAVGGVGNQILTVTNQIEDFEYAAKRSGQSISIWNSTVSQASGAVGKLGVLSLATGAFITGWKIGTWISDMTGWGKAIGQTTEKLIDLMNATEDGKKAVALQQQQIDLSRKVMDKYNLTQEQLAGLMKANNADITAVAGQLMKFNGNVELASKGLAVNNALLKTGSDNSRAYKQAGDQLENTIKKMNKAQEDAAKAAAKAAEEQKKEVEMIHATKDAIDLLVPGLTNVQKASQAWMETFGRGSEDIKEFQIRLEDLAPAQKTVAEYFADQTAKSSELSQTLDEAQFKVNTVANAFLEFSGILSGVSGIIGELANAIGGKLGQALNSIGSAVDGGAQAFAGFGQIMSGDLLGGIQNVIGGIGKLFSALKQLFGHNWEKDTKNIIENIHGITGVSKELQEQIAKLAEEIGDADTAFILSLNDIIDEVGITEQTLQALHDVFSFLERGQITAAQAADILNGAWDDLAKAGTDSFGLISDQMKELIALSQQFGLEVPAITEFLNQQAQALAGTFEGLISGISDKAGAQGIADILKQTFESLGGGPEALSQLSGAIDAIKAKLKEMGLTMADVGLGFLNQLNNISKKFPEFAQQIGSVNTALVSLSNMGLLTAGSFKTLQDQAIKAFEKINKDGKVSKAELAAMMPTLQLLAKLALDYGYALDPATIALLKQAGLWDDVTNKPKKAGDETQDAMTRAADAMERVAEALEKVVGGFTDATNGALGLGAAVGGIPRDLTIGVNFDVGEIPVGGGNGTVRSRAGLETMEMVNSVSQLYLLHQGEGIVSKEWMQQLMNGKGLGGSKTLNIAPGAFVIQGSGLDQNQLMQAIIDAIRKGILGEFRK